MQSHPYKKTRGWGWLTSELAQWFASVNRLDCADGSRSDSLPEIFDEELRDPIEDVHARRGIAAQIWRL